MQPNLIHPIPIVIEPIDRTNTVYDEEAREPLRNAARKTTVTVPGQIQPLEASSFLGFRGGPARDYKLRIIFRIVDCQRRGWEPKRGDRITKMGSETTELYVMALGPAAHYPDMNGRTLYNLYIADRRPSATEPEIQ